MRRAVSKILKSVTCSCRFTVTVVSYKPLLPPQVFMIATAKHKADGESSDGEGNCCIQGTNTEVFFVEADADVATRLPVGRSGIGIPAGTRNTTPAVEPTQHPVPGFFLGRKTDGS